MIDERPEHDLRNAMQILQYAAHRMKAEEDGGFPMMLTREEYRGIRDRLWAALKKLETPDA